MTILEIIVATCAIHTCATSSQEAQKIQAQQTSCVEELSTCVDRSEEFGLSETKRFKICLNVRNKYGSVHVPDRMPQSESKPRAKEIR